MKKVLITYQIPQEGLSELKSECEVTYPDKLVLSVRELLDQIAKYDGVITAFGHPFPAEVLLKARNLKIISNFGAGVDNIPVQEASRLGILVTNTPDAVTQATAELTLALMLTVFRRISNLDHNLRSGDIVWGIMENIGRTLYGKNLGIIGMGRIGTAVATMARAMGMHVFYHNRHRLQPGDEARFEVEWLPLPILLNQSDIVSLHVPLNSETYHLISITELQQMKSGAILINTSRGAVIDEMALTDALDRQIISGAGLDVYENEPDIPSDLLKLDQVVLTPHIGTATIETRVAMAREAAGNILDFFHGRRPKNMINSHVYTQPDSGR